ncbi:uncharacterized protein LOC132749204 [Ruditapes philippinarum]|uniref:uncharacterized protein LOC132749204 n=1 Tax=Ruditapes philippinarum TaxID=129788 RepID=UPI00295A86FC|nr:uncharacterized protein LOC132749204 [Ruditapes philippinarum]
MAKSEKDFKASVTQDSDEVQEMFCEHCDKHDKKYVPAEGFCEECFEYLCGTCVKFHKRLLVSHIIKDKDNMPQDFCLEKCSIHYDELIKFYCQACKKFACTKCKIQDHGNCKMVGHLPALVSGIENSKEIEELKENIDEIMNDLKNTEEQTIAEETTEMSYNLLMISMELDDDQRCQMFVAMKKGQENIEQLKLDADKQCYNNSIHYYKVECTASDQNITDIQDCDKFFTFQEVPKSKVERTASFFTDYQYTIDSTSSLCLLSEDCLLISNCKSSNLIIEIDLWIEVLSPHHLPRAIIDLPSEPWAAAKVDNNKVAVTFPKLGTIRLITFSKYTTVTNTEDIKVGKCCHGVAYSNNKLIVSYTNKQATVKILDMSGKVLKTLDKDHHGKCLFVNPHHLTISADNTVIYVSDLEKNCVISLTFDGKVKAIYNDDQLKGPYQLTIDRSGAVFVCGRLSDNIHQLSPDLSKMKILLDKEQEQGINGPVGVAYGQKNNRLYVSQHAGSIKVYDLTLEYM